MALNDIPPARPLANAGRKRVRIDWKRGASLLIDGETPTAVCAALGIDEDRLWRHLRSSLRFQYLLRQARERRRLLGRLKLESVSREAVLRLARSADKPEAMLIAQLAQTAQGEGDAAAKDGDVIARLAESGRRPPNQAFRKRLAVERKQMDAEFADHCRAIAAHAEMQAGAQAADAAAKPENKTQISGNKPAFSAEKSASSESSARIADPHPPAGEGGTRVSGRVRAMPASTQSNSTIVDLTDIYGNPIAGAHVEMPGNGTPARADAWPG